MPDFTDLKKKHREIWASGDYDQIAQGIQPIADHVVRAARIHPGERVLDIACGTGNTAISARARGAIVTGLDLAPELLDVAQKRALAEGYDDITWQEGDAENLPFEDGSFDVVVSSCGLMFTPDQQRAADEVARVTKRGGRIAIQAWSGDGGVGGMEKIISTYVPPAPSIPSPLNWSEEGKIRTLFRSSFGNYQFERYDCPEYAETPEELADLYIEKFGPTNRIFHAIAPTKAEAFRKDLINLFEGYVTPADRKVRWGREYLITLADRT